MRPHSMGWSAGLDFETRPVVKDNLAEALRAERARPGPAPTPSTART